MQLVALLPEQIPEPEPQEGHPSKPRPSPGGLLIGRSPQAILFSSILGCLLLSPQRQQSPTEFWELRGGGGPTPPCSLLIQCDFLEKLLERVISGILANREKDQHAVRRQENAGIPGRLSASVPLSQFHNVGKNDGRRTAAHQFHFISLVNIYRVTEPPNF